MENTSSTLSLKSYPVNFNISNNNYRDFIINAKTITPGVKLSYDRHCLIVEGCSGHANPKLFYTKLNRALDRYIQSNNNELKVHLNFEYLNSSSIECLSDLMKTLQFMNYLGKEVSINWYYSKHNNLMLEYGQGFQNDFPQQVHLIER